VRRNKPIRWLLALALGARLTAAGGIDPAQYLEDVKFLSSDELQGRASGSPGLDKAAGYIEAQFRADGLEPLAGGYRLAFPVAVSATCGEGNRMAFRDGPKLVDLKLDSEFRPLSFSSSGVASGQVVFAGYGITAPEYGYDDYRGIDVTGKLVLVLRHEPQEYDEKSVFAGRIYTNHTQLESKGRNARLHGARGVILVADRPNHPNSIDELPGFSGAVGSASLGIPFVEVTADVAEEWVRRAGRTLDSVVKAIDKDLRPRSFALPRSFHVDLATDVRQQLRGVQNVVGYLPGRSEEYLIVGAHYDHVGLGEQFSLAPSLKGTVHPGADDNGSGSAGLIELARWFAGQPRHRRGIVFVAFAAEELGLLGSNFYVDHPVLPLGKAIAMINMDMIGRLRSGQLFIGGVATGSTFKKIVDEANRPARFEIESADHGGYGSSDQYSFTPKQIPFMFFFTGLHPDYHTPSDTWDKIDAGSTARLVDFIAAVAQRLVDSPQRPRFVKPSR